MSILLLFPRQSLFEATARQTFSPTDKNLKRVNIRMCKRAIFGRKIYPIASPTGPFKSYDKAESDGIIAF